MRECPRGDHPLRARAHRDFCQQDSYESPLFHSQLHRCSIPEVIHGTNRYNHDCEPGAREVRRVTACSQV